MKTGFIESFTENDFFFVFYEMARNLLPITDVCEQFKTGNVNI